VIFWERWMVVAPERVLGTGGLLALDDVLMENALRAGVVETVGAVEAELMLLAKNSRSKTLCLRHDRESNRQRMAARRLVARDLLAEPNYMSAGFPGGGLYFYALTPRGLQCWLRYPKSKEQGR
jgi:hypothetical protein